MTDKRVSQLISKSIRGKLTSEESDLVKENLEVSEESKRFAKLSKLIQGSVSHGAVEAVANDSGVDGTLSSESMRRMKESVAKAIEEQARLSEAGLLDENQQYAPTIARASDLTKNASQSPVGEERRLSSRFRLTRRLGQGGLGNVWLARDEKLNRSVAIKELNSDALESPIAWQRFHREAEITGHLEHPNVVPLYQFGEDATTGEPFYAMRFVGKRTLADAIVEHYDRVEAGEDCSLGLHRLLSVFLDVCQAIAYAHSRGVIHRDINPENVALDNFGQVIVLDWGLAKILEDGELATKLTSNVLLSDSALTNTLQGDIVGTPLYMAPEQAAGDLDSVDDKTDIYGLGAVLFSILSGSAPHQNSVPDGESVLSDILKTISEGETPRVRQFKKCVPFALDEICAKAMAHKPHLRFDAVTDLATAVESWMAGQSQKKASYDNLRMEGRELRAELQSSVRDLERNVRFMSTLPPIQELIKVQDNEDCQAWRDRLSTIFRGLLRANPDYQNVVYSRVDGDQFSELVRVERHSQDATSIRNVPRTRLRKDEVNEHMQLLETRQPEEVLTSLVCDPMCDRSDSCKESVGLVVGVPVYNEVTEEFFGVVMINYNVNQFLRRQLGRRNSSAEVVVACDVFHIMMHSRANQIVESTLTKKVAVEAPQFLSAVDTLQTELEFIDEDNADIYGARLWLVPEKHGIMYLLKQ